MEKFTIQDGEMYVVKIERLGRVLGNRIKIGVYEYEHTFDGNFNQPMILNYTNTRLSFDEARHLGKALIEMANEDKGE